MKLQQIQEQWWYRLFSVVYYFIYIATVLYLAGVSLAVVVLEGDIEALSLLFLGVPGAIIIFECMRGFFFYVLTGDWNWRFKEKKKMLGSIKRYFVNEGEYGLSRFSYNLLLCILIVPAVLMSLAFIFSPIESETAIGAITLPIALIIFLILSFYRFHNIGASGKYICGLLIPIVNIILFGRLIFKESSGTSEKYKNESLLITLILLGVLFWGTVMFFTSQISKIQNSIPSQNNNSVNTSLESEAGVDAYYEEIEALSQKYYADITGYTSSFSSIPENQEELVQVFESVDALDRLNDSYLENRSIIQTRYAEDIDFTTSFERGLNEKMKEKHATEKNFIQALRDFYRYLDEIQEYTTLNTNGDITIEGSDRRERFNNFAEQVHFWQEKGDTMNLEIKDYILYGNN